MPAATQEHPTCRSGLVDPPRIRIGLPFLGSPGAGNPDNLAVALSSRLGLPVEIAFYDRYDDLTSGLEEGQLEAAILPPLEYVRAHDLDPCLRARLTIVFDGAVRYSSYLVIRRDSGLTDVRQLKGRRGAFVDTTSASGWLFPLERLAESDIDPFRDFSDVQFLGSHGAVIQAVIDGRADVGATYPGGIDSARREGLDTGSLAILAITGRIPFDALVLRPDLDAPRAASLVDAFASIDSTRAEDRAALSFSLNASGFVPSNDALYDEVRQVLHRVRTNGGGPK